MKSKNIFKGLSGWLQVMVLDFLCSSEEADGYGQSVQWTGDRCMWLILQCPKMLLQIQLGIQSN